jgi:WD40 repeat protein
MCITGPEERLVVTGCHSGNLTFHKENDIKDTKTLQQAHSNLIRVLLSLSSLDHRYFLSADVSGTIKVWKSAFLYSRVEKKKRETIVQ